MRSTGSDGKSSPISCDNLSVGGDRSMIPIGLNFNSTLHITHFGGVVSFGLLSYLRWKEQNL